MTQNWHEVAILSLLIKRKELLFEIEDDLFEDPKAQKILETMRKFISEGIEFSTKEISLLLDKDYAVHLKHLRRFIREPLEEEIIFQMLGNKIVKKAILHDVPSLSELNLTSYDKISRAILRAESLYTKETGDTFETYAKVLEEQADKFNPYEQFPTFLNKVFLCQGEVGLIEALPKGGKTVSLVNLGTIGIIHGAKVYHWSLEIPKKQLFARYAARITGNSQAHAEAMKKIKFYGGKLVVRDEPYCSMKDIRSWVVKGKPDLLIVDYADLISPNRKMKERRFELRETYLSLRNLAKELNIPVWSASQAAAKAEKKVNRGGYIGLEDLEEAKVVKAGTAALIISLNQTPEEKEDGLIRSHIALSTHGFPMKFRRLDIDYRRQHIKELGKE